MFGAGRRPTERVRRGSARGELWRELPPDVDAAVVAWATDGQLTGGEPLKPGRVHRFGSAVLKAYPVQGFLPSLLRPDPAWREARLAHAIHPVSAAEPWATLRGPHGSLLVSEFLVGTPLHRAWGESARARETLPSLLAQMHLAGVLHGDPHFDNLLWTGDRWVLLDLISLRRGWWHRLGKRRLMTRHWARLVHDLTYFHADAEPELSRLHEAYCAAMQSAGQWAPTWSAILRGKAAYADRPLEAAGES